MDIGLAQRLGHRLSRCAGGCADHPAAGGKIGSGAASRVERSAASLEESAASLE